MHPPRLADRIVGTLSLADRGPVDAPAFAGQSIVEVVPGAGALTVGPW